MSVESCPKYDAINNYYFEICNNQNVLIFDTYYLICFQNKYHVNDIFYLNFILKRRSNLIIKFSAINTLKSLLFTICVIFLYGFKIFCCKKVLKYK